MIAEKNTLLEIVLKCRDESLSKRLHYFSKEFLASRLLSIIRFNEDEKENICDYTAVSRNIFSYFDAISNISDTEKREVRERTNLTIKYSEKESKLMQVTFGFVLENDNWVIGFVGAPREISA